MTSNLEKIWSTDINLLDNQLLTNNIDINQFTDPIEKYIKISQLADNLTNEEQNIINDPNFYDILKSQPQNLTSFQKLSQTVKQINQNILAQKFGNQNLTSHSNSISRYRQNPISRSNIRSNLSSRSILTSEIINQGFLNLLPFENSSKSSYEIEFLETYSPCDSDKISLISLNLSSLDVKKLKDQININFFDYNMMATTSCIIRAFTNSPENIHQLITNVHQIGNPSVYGIALDADLNKKSKQEEIAENFFILKYPKRGSLNHECFVAFKATNYLRQNCPNFMYIFDTFDCSIPVIAPDGKAINWCNKYDNQDNTIYAILENCHPNISFSEFCKNCSLKDFIRYYFQIVLAIREGYLKYKFTHYDMHTGNILLRKVSSDKFYIPYETLQGIIYLESLEYISTIIDYGFSYIEVDSQHFGFNLKLPKGVYIQALPITDVYKLLCSSLFLMKKYNNPTFENAKYLLNFFIDSSDYEQFINQQLLNNFYLPLIPEVIKINYDDYIDYCLEFITKMKISDIIQKNNPNGKILKCGYSEDKMMASNIIKKCNTSNYYLNTVGVPLSSTTTINIITFLDFYNLHKKLSEEHIINTIKLKQIQDNFLKNYSEAFSKERIEIKKIIDQINLNNNQIYYFPKNDPKKILNPEVLKLTSIYTTKNVEFLQLYQNLLDRLKIGRYIQKVYQLKSPNKFIDYYNSIENYLRENQIYKNTIINHYYENVKFLKINQGIYPEIKNSPYKYYWEDYMKLKEVMQN